MKTFAKETGLTLIELILTILIIAVIASLVMPRIEIFTSGNLRSFALKFSGEINYYFNQSVLKKVPYKIEINFSEGNYYNVYNYEEGEWKKIRSKVLLPKGVFFKDIITGQDNFTINNGSGEILFSSMGYMDGVTIHLTDGKDKYFSLITNSISGKVFIFDKYKTKTQ